MERRILIGLALVAVAVTVYESFQEEESPAESVDALEPPVAALPEANTPTAAVKKEEPLPAERVVEAGPPPARAKKTNTEFPKTPQSMLALSWQPSFCQTHQNKRECRSQTAARADATQFSLHGLWPDGCAYEGVPESEKQKDMNRRWRDLEDLDLKPELQRRLAVGMPGMASDLHKHEWVKHGTCDGRDPTGYYEVSLGLLEQVNNSELGKLFANRINQRVTIHEARAAFERSFGPGSGKALVMKCDNKLIGEIRIRLGRPFDGDTPLGDVTRNNNARSCKSGVVDAAGF